MPWNPFSRPSRDRSDAEAQIEHLEKRASVAAAEYRARYLNRAGDVAASSGDLPRALRLWGLAIDGYLESSRPDAAAAACRKVIRQDPTVVRAHRTLTLLAIGHGRLDEAATNLRSYVAAATAAGSVGLAVKQLRLMARICPDAEFSRIVAQALRELGDAAGGLRNQAAGNPVIGSPSPDPQERWAAILRAAHMTAAEVDKQD